MREPELKVQVNGVELQTDLSGRTRLDGFLEPLSEGFGDERR